MNDGATPIPIPDLMRRLSVHLDSLAAEVHEIEHAIGQELGKDSTFDDGQIKRLQRLDFLRQSLEDMALLKHFMADHLIGEIPNGLESRLRLESTRTLLKPRQKQPEPVLQSRALGDVDLF